MYLTDHAKTRMAQRGIALKDAELITLIGTEVPGGILVREKDCQRIEKEIKRLLDRIRRLRGKRLVLCSGKIVTAYHLARRHEQRLLRRAYESDFDD
jgi:hypothetical protein